jgi:hypothetical protein
MRQFQVHAMQIAQPISDDAVLIEPTLSTCCSIRTDPSNVTSCGGTLRQYSKLGTSLVRTASHLRGERACLVGYAASVVFSA